MRLASRDVCDDETWANTVLNRSSCSVQERLYMLAHETSAVDAAAGAVGVLLAAAAAAAATATSTAVMAMAATTTTITRATPPSTPGGGAHGRRRRRLVFAKTDMVRVFERDVVLDEFSSRGHGGGEGVHDDDAAWSDESSEDEGENGGGAGHGRGGGGVVLHAACAATPFDNMSTLDLFSSPDVSLDGW